MSPLFVSTRTATSEFHATHHTDAPSKTAPSNAPVPIFVTRNGQAEYAVMFPERTLTRTTAFAYIGTSHIDCPSKTPPANAPWPMLDTPLGHAPYAVIVTLSRMGLARTIPV
jgi:hypothetical protein